MEKQPDKKASSIAVCRSPEFGEPSPRLVEELSRFIGNHFLLIDPASGHTNVILVSDFYEAGGHTGIPQEIDCETLQRIQDAAIIPDLN